MSRKPMVATVLLACSALLPFLAVWRNWDWYLDSPLLLVFAIAGGYSAGAWLPRIPAALGVVSTAAALVIANQAHGVSYHWLDDLVFFLVVVGGPAVAGGAVTIRAEQVRRLERLQAELDEQHRIEVAAARLDELNRVQRDVHSSLAERIAGIALRAEGAHKRGDATALPALENEARAALDDLRAALGSMRASAASVPESSAAVERITLTRMDFLVPLAVGAAMAIETLLVSHARGPLWANVLAPIVVAAPLIARRRHPTLSTSATAAFGVAMSALLTPISTLVTGVALLVVLFYVVGAWCRGWSWLLGWALVAAGTLGMEAVAGLSDDAGDSDEAWIVLTWTVGAVVVGRITAGWQERVRRMRAVVEALEQGRDAAIRLAAAQEREALARELHDTVAHAMTVVCLQAGAHQRAGTDTARALRLIASVADQSLIELRDGLEAMETAAAPLDRSRLSAIARRAGVDAEVDVAPIPSGAAATLAYRVVREAIVNIARHAPGARASVRIAQESGRINLEVIDTGSEESAEINGTGTGLRGLAETVRSAGGTFASGPLESGGFRVAATIPRDNP